MHEYVDPKVQAAIVQSRKDALAGIRKMEQTFMDQFSSSLHKIDKYIDDCSVENPELAIALQSSQKSNNCDFTNGTPKIVKRPAKPATYFTRQEVSESDSNDDDPFAPLKTRDDSDEFYY